MKSQKDKKFSGLDFLVNREIVNQINKIEEDDLRLYANQGCNKCFGVGRRAYRIDERGTKKIIVCRCVLKTIKKSILQEVDLVDKIAKDEDVNAANDKH